MLESLRDRAPRLTELSLFVLVGATGVAVDFAVFVPLVRYAAMDPRLAALASFSVAVSWNYLWNRRITFPGAQATPLSRSYVAFVAVCAVGAAVRLLVMHLLIVGAGWGRPPIVYLTNLAGIVAATSVNFLGARQIAFRTRHEHASRREPGSTQEK